MSVVPWYFNHNVETVTAERYRKLIYTSMTLGRPGRQRGKDFDGHNPRERILVIVILRTNICSTATCHKQLSEMYLEIIAFHVQYFHCTVYPDFVN